MKRGALIIALVVLAEAPASAHNVPARRTVTVQAEKDKAVVLVTWTSPRGPLGAQLLARASWGRSDNAIKALRSLAAAEALRGLRFEFDGTPAAASALQVKVRVDRGNGTDPPRIVCAVLVTIDTSSKGDLVVRADGRVATGLRWFDRSEGAVTSPSRSKNWLRGRRVLRVRF